VFPYKSRSRRELWSRLVWRFPDRQHKKSIE
jgi:hypothetical protein